MGRVNLEGISKIFGSNSAKALDLIAQGKREGFAASSARRNSERPPSRMRLPIRLA